MNTLRDSRYVKTVLTLIAIALVAIMIELATLIPTILPTAQAQIPDSALQRKEMTEAIERTNQKLDDLKDVLRTQVLKVRVVATDTDKKTAQPLKPVSGTK